MAIPGYKLPAAAAVAVIPEVEGEAVSPSKLPILPDFNTDFEKVMKSSNDDFRQEQHA